MPKQNDCCLCFSRCKPNARRHVPPGTAFKKYMQRILGRDVVSSDMVCATCTARIYRSLPKSDDRTEIHSTQNSNERSSDPDYVPPPDTKKALTSPKSINLNIPATPRSHRKCIVCRRDSSYRNHLVVVPQSAASQAFIQSGIFIHPQSRCCGRHLDKALFNNQALNLLGTSKTNDWFSRSDIVNLLSNIRQMISTHSNYLNFDAQSNLTEEDYVTLTGLTKGQFDQLIPYLSTLRNSCTRSVRTCLGVFLLKLRTGLSNKIIGVLSGLNQAQVQRIMTSTRIALMEDFVPEHLGFQHMTHDTFSREHTTQMAKTLFNVGENEACIVMDGTYIYIQKSADYIFQRKSFSMHKNRPLVKLMVVVGTDGYVLTVLGPYFANGSNNDASITKHIMKVNEDASEWFRDGDTFIVDRGFRDAVDFLQEKGFSVRMPSYLKKGTKQHTTEEANVSRLVTKVRWVVESANGRIKQWKLLDKVMPNRLLGSIGDFVRIVCALCNRFREPLASTVNDPDADSMAKCMLEKSMQPNEVLKYLEENNLLRKRTIFEQISSDNFDDFPILSYEKLRNITFGVYQLKHAPNYTRQHLDNDGGYELMVHRENSNLLKVKIESRHSSSVLHTLWIRYDKVSQNEPVKGWYCTCKVGSRVVGCCAHVASVLWYLGLERHQASPTHMVDLSNHMVLDAADIPETDSDSDGTDEMIPEE